MWSRSLNRARLFLNPACQTAHQLPHLCPSTHLKFQYKSINRSQVMNIHDHVPGIVKSRLSSTDTLVFTHLVGKPSHSALLNICTRIGAEMSPACKRCSAAILPWSGSHLAWSFSIARSQLHSSFPHQQSRKELHPICDTYEHHEQKQVHAQKNVTRFVKCILKEYTGPVTNDQFQQAWHIFCGKPSARIAFTLN